MESRGKGIKGRALGAFILLFALMFVSGTSAEEMRKPFFSAPAKWKEAPVDSPFIVASFMTGGISTVQVRMITLRKDTADQWIKDEVDVYKKDPNITRVSPLRKENYGTLEWTVIEWEARLPKQAGGQELLAQQYYYPIAEGQGILEVRCMGIKMGLSDVGFKSDLNAFFKGIDLAGAKNFLSDLRQFEVAYMKAAEYSQRNECEKIKEAYRSLPAIPFTKEWFYIKNLGIGMCEYFTRDYDEAIAFCKEGLRSEYIKNGDFFMGLIHAYEAKGDMVPLLAYLIDGKKAVRDPALWDAAIARVYWLIGAKSGFTRDIVLRTILYHEKTLATGDPLVADATMLPRLKEAVTIYDQYFAANAPVKMDRVMLNDPGVNKGNLFDSIIKARADQKQNGKGSEVEGITALESFRQEEYEGALQKARQYK